MKAEKNLEKKVKSMDSFEALGVIIAFSIVYGLGVLNTAGEINPFKWKEKSKEIGIKINQSSYRQQFQSLDKNKDYKIDSTEFIYRK